MNKGSNCIVCTKPLTGRQQNYCCTKCKNMHFQSYAAQVERGTEKRKKHIKSLGGFCVNCGYNENYSALVFVKDGNIMHLTNRDFANRDENFISNLLGNARIYCKNCASAKQTLKEIIKREKGLDNKLFLANLNTLGISRADYIVVGVSGGVDSATLLGLLLKNGFKNLIIAHLNHNVREEADADEDFVRKLAKKHKLSFESKKLTSPKTGNLEEKLRDERRAFLLNVANKNKAKFIVLAHNKNDQAETLILNLVRGSGSAGLAAMEFKSGKIIRPLLNISRVDIETYAQTNKLEWREDATNRDINYSRNYVRHIVLPRLERLNQEVLDVLFDTTMQSREVNSHLKKEANVYHNSTVKELSKLDDPVLFEVFAQNVEKVKGDRKDLSTKNFMGFKKLIASNSGTKIMNLPDGIIVRRRYDKLDFCLKKEDNKGPLPPRNRLKVGKNIFGGWVITVESGNFSQGEINKNRKFQKLYINNEKFPSIFVRPKISGEKIDKIGLEGHKKLQDLFTDAKIDKDDRKDWPIITDENDETIWVPGLAIAKKIKTKHAKFRITVRKETSEK